MARNYKKQFITVGKSEVEAHLGRSHNYKPTSLKLLSKVGLNSWMLDVGGGDRIINHPNFLNFDRFKHSGSVTIVGDAHYLPFKDNSFDLILCEAAIEHFRKPWVAVDEFYRILKIGGYIYADIAFLQPVHAYPNHYFNMTREGARVLFEKFKEVKSGVQEYQMPSYALASLLSRYVRGLLSGLDKNIGKFEFYESGTFISGSKNSLISSLFAFIYRCLSNFLRRLDPLIKPERAEEIAAGIFFLGKKINK